MPAASASSAQATPKEIWQNTKAELQLQLPRATYETWLKDARFLAYEDGEFVIGVSNPFALDWLNNSNLRPLIKRTLARLWGRAVEVRFVAQPRRVREEEPLGPAPLLEAASPAITEASQALRQAQGLAGNGHQPLNPRYTFETFVVGESNELAYTAAKTVAKRPGQAYNPLFIYGGVGLGKTHLLHSIGHETQRQGLRTLYVPAEGFTNDFITSLRNGSPEAFREKYRHAVDVLLIDDIQFIAGKESTQEELFHTFNALTVAGKQIVLTSDSLPNRITALEKRLSSRFEGGLCVDLQPPGLETRIEILRVKAKAMGWTDVPDGVLGLIAQRMPGNIRRLEGALNRVIAQAQLKGGPPTVAVAEAALSDWLPSQPAADAEAVLTMVAAHFQVTVAELKGAERSRRVTLPRQVAVLLLHEELGLNRSQIGRLLGGRDHSTVNHALKRIRKLMESDAGLRRRVHVLREDLRVPVAVRV